MEITLTSTQYVVATLQPVDSLGRPAKYQTGSVVYTSADPTIVTVTPFVDNELLALVTAVSEGVTAVSFTATNLAGVQFTGVFQVTVTGSDAVGFTVTFGDIFEQTTSTTTTSTSTEAPIV